MHVLYSRSRYDTPTAGILICFLIVVSLATFDFSSIVDLLNGVLAEFTFCSFFALANTPAQQTSEMINIIVLRVNDRCTQLVAQSSLPLALDIPS